ncbi:hypothetical protein AB1N83_004985 [Pleurotus pulmonarius]
MLHVYLISAPLGSCKTLSVSMNPSTNISVISQDTSPLIGAVDVLPRLFGALDFLGNQNNTLHTVILTAFSSLASLAQHPSDRLSLSALREVTRKVPGAGKYYPLLLRHVEMLQASDDLHDESITAVAISPSGAILSASSTKVVIRNKTQTRAIDIGNQWAVSFQADGSKFATGDQSGNVKIWDIETGKALQTLRAQSDAVWSLAFSPDGSQIAVGLRNRMIRVWDTKTGRDAFGATQASPVRGLAFSPDGTRFTSGATDGTVRIWDRAGKYKVLGEHGGSVRSMAFSNDQIVSASVDETIRVWDASSGDLVRVLRGHTSDLRCVAFSQDFKLVASGSYDCTARLWDVSSGKVLAIYEVGEPLWSIAFSPDGNQIVTGSEYGKVHIWNADVSL